MAEVEESLIWYLNNSTLDEYYNKHNREFGYMPVLSECLNSFPNISLEAQEYITLYDLNHRS